MSNQRVLPIASGENFRELGGYPAADGKTTKWHKLLRSGNLSNLNQADLKTLENYGVKYDVDLRSEPEAEVGQDQIDQDHMKYIFDPVFEEDDTENSKTPEEMNKLLLSDPDYGHCHMIHVYQRMVKMESCREAFKKLFDVLLENTGDEQSVLFHCTAGKDRTGMSATFILSALGVDPKTIKEDYLLTNKVAKPVIDKRLSQAKDEGLSEIGINNLRQLYSVSTEFLDAALDEVNKLYGSMDSFLHEGLGLTDDNISQLRKIYLD